MITPKENDLGPDMLTKPSITEINESGFALHRTPGGHIIAAARVNVFVQYVGARRPPVTLAKHPAINLPIIDEAFLAWRIPIVFTKEMLRMIPVP